MMSDDWNNPVALTFRRARVSRAAPGTCGAIAWLNPRVDGST